MIAEALRSLRTGLPLREPVDRAVAPRLGPLPSAAAVAPAPHGPRRPPSRAPRGRRPNFSTASVCGTGLRRSRCGMRRGSDGPGVRATAPGRAGVMSDSTYTRPRSAGAAGATGPTDRVRASRSPRSSRAYGSASGRPPRAIGFRSRTREPSSCWRSRSSPICCPRKRALSRRDPPRAAARPSRRRHGVSLRPRSPRRPSEWRFPRRSATASRWRSRRRPTAAVAYASRFEQHDRGGRPASAVDVAGLLPGPRAPRRGQDTLLLGH